jgi:5-formyltetrahydrofolate cyclo-ligase
MNVDLVLVPGLAFTSTGLRLGRGGGIYDRLLSTLNSEKSLTMGICYENQIVDSIPVEKHDRPVDLVISNR